MAGDKNHLTFVNLETDIFQGFETAGIRFWKLVRNGSWVFLKIGSQTAGVIDRATCRLKNGDIHRL